MRGIASTAYTDKKGSTKQDQTILQKIHDEANELISQKNRDIEQLNNNLNEAEKQLLYLKQQIKNQEKTVINEDLKSNDLEKLNEEINTIKKRHEEEIRQVQQNNKEEIMYLEDSYKKQLEDAKLWAEQHADQILIERKTHLNDLVKQFNSLKESVSEQEFNATKTKAKLLEESKFVTMNNEQKLHFLENQLSELSSLSREEHRSIRAKIEETLTAYELRKKTHQSEIEKLSKEIDDRQMKYDQHLEALTDQFEKEKQKYDLFINSSEIKFNTIQRVMKQLEKHHEKQIQTTLTDNERMKFTIYSSKTRDDEKLIASKTAMETSSLLSIQCRKMEQDLDYIKSEIKELDSESVDLKNELARLQRTIQHKNK